MMEWLFAGLVVGFAAIAAFTANLRRAVLALWFSGLAAGGLFLSFNAELLALVQMVTSTAVGLSFMFFVIMFEKLQSDFKRNLSGRLSRISGFLVMLIPAICFLGAIWLGVKTHFHSGGSNAGSAANLLTLGRELMERHFLTLEILALTFLLLVTGAGVLSRPGQKEGGPER